MFLSLGCSAFCGRMSQCWPCLLAEKGDTLYFMVRRTTPVNFDRESKADAERYANSGWRRWRSGTCKLTTRWRRRRPRREAPAAHELSSARSSSGDARRPRLSRPMHRTTEPTPTPARAPWTNQPLFVAARSGGTRASPPAPPAAPTELCMGFRWSGDAHTIW